MNAFSAAANILYLFFIRWSKNLINQRTVIYSRRNDADITKSITADIGIRILIK